MDVGMSQYELVRLENIRKNEEFLKALGLYSDGGTMNGMTAAAVGTGRRIVKDKEKRKQQKVKIEGCRADAAPERLTRSKRKIVDGVQEGAIDTSTDKESDIDAIQRGHRKTNQGNNIEDGMIIDMGDDDDDSETLTRFSHTDLENYLKTIKSEHVNRLSDEVMLISNAAIFYAIETIYV